MLIAIMRVQKFTTNLCQRIIDLVGSTKTMDDAVTPVTSDRR